MKNDADNLVALLGRILLAALFIWSGVGKIGSYNETAAFMAQHNLPVIAILLPLTILVEAGGGVLLLLGWKARAVSVVLAGFTLLSALIFHQFWVGGDQAHMQAIHFMKNVAIVGGLLMVYAAGAGRYSVDGPSG